MTTWWESEPRVEISQGDVFDDVLLGRPIAPSTFLFRRSVSGGGDAWFSGEFKADNDGIVCFLARGRITKVLVISHDCEIDKSAGRRKGVVLVAPVISAKRLTTEQRVPIFTQKRRSAMALPGLPNFGDHYLDLRQMTFVATDCIPMRHRVASMTDAARERLQAQLVAFLTRKDTEL